MFRLLLPLSCNFVFTQSVIASEQFHLSLTRLGSSYAIVFRHFPTALHAGNISILSKSHFLDNSEIQRQALWSEFENNMGIENFYV